jgi:hypothetical protein
MEARLLGAIELHTFRGEEATQRKSLKPIAV